MTLPFTGCLSAEISSVQVEVAVSLRNQRLDVAMFFARSFHVAFNVPHIVAISLDPEVMYPSDASREFDELKDLERGKVSAKWKNVFVTLEPMISG